jgi:hypothetical protein
MITQTTLHQLLAYNPASGLFRWRKNLTNGIKRGRVAGYSHKGYTLIRIANRKYSAASLAFLYIHGVWSRLDHIDGVRSNNRLSNLRPATQAQNCANRRTSGRYQKGAHFHRRDRLFEARICKEGRTLHLGCFKTEAEAHAAYCQAAAELHGEFAWPSLRTNGGGPQ